MSIKANNAYYSYNSFRCSIHLIINYNNNEYTLEIA